MTNAAPLRDDLLSVKGAAKPMPANGPNMRTAPPDTLAWRPAAARRLSLVSLAPWIKRHDGGAHPPRAPAMTPPTDTPNRRVRVSLRLDKDRHQRLKQACACDGRTQQSVLVEALDDFLARRSVVESDGERRKQTPE